MAKIIQEAPFKFATGDGTTSRYSVARPDHVIDDAQVDAVYRKDWEGENLLYRTPRTNLAVYSNDFLAAAWSGPSLYLDFANQNYWLPNGKVSFSSLVNFSRASDATVWTQNGVLDTVGVNVPRFQYDPATGEAEGLLLEPQRTNLVKNSSDLTKWIKINAITVESVESVLGFPSATFIQSGASNGHVYSSVITFNEGENYMLSCVFELLPESTHFGFYLRGGGIPTTHLTFKIQGAEYVLERNDFPSDPIVTPLGNNCVRVSLWYSPSETIGRNLAIHGSYNLQNNPVVVSHTQVEQIGTSDVELPTTPIITDGTQVTRAADNFSIPFGDWYNPNAGALVLKIGEGSALNAVNDIPPVHAFGLVSGNLSVSNPDFKGVYFGSDSGVIRNVWVGIGGENRDAVVTHDIYPNDTLCLSWNHDTLTLAVNGEVVGTATDGRVPVALRGADNFRVNPALGMQLPYLSFYNRALSEAEMIALTA